MCVTTPGPRREPTLWWALVSYFRGYPPLVQAAGLEARSKAGRSPREGTAKAKRPPIRVYW